VVRIWTVVCQTSFSSLFIGIVAATSVIVGPSVGDYCSFSSLFIGIVAATKGGETWITLLRWFQFPIHWDCGCNWRAPVTIRIYSNSFSSLFIGIVAATKEIRRNEATGLSFSSLFIGIVAAT